MSNEEESSVPVEAPTPSHLAPILATFGIIYCATDEGSKSHEKSIEELNDNLFELTPEENPLFLDKLIHCYQEINWSDE